MAKKIDNELEQQQAKEILKLVGGANNVVAVMNCMTRVRFTLKDMTKANDAKIKQLELVSAVVKDSQYQVVIGIGKASRVRKLIEAELKTVVKSETSETKVTQEKATIKKVDNPKPEHMSEEEWKKYKDSFRGKMSQNKYLLTIKNAAGKMGVIFGPLLPAIFAAGLLFGIGSMFESISMLAWGDNGSGGPDYDLYPDGMNFFIYLLKGLGNGFLAYLPIFVGWRAAKVAGATPVLGGMLGGISLSPLIDEISKILGMYDYNERLDSILISGKGGIIAILMIAWVLKIVENFIRSKTPDLLDVIVVPLVTMFLVGSILILGIMPLAGGITWVLMQFFDLIIGSQYTIVNVIGGYILAATFLWMVVFGLHHALIPIYATQLAQNGKVTLFPILAMAGAGQVGATIAIWYRNKKREKSSEKLNKSCISGIVPGVLGVGEPLIYGITLPMGFPFITAGLGAGFGGALVAGLGVGSTAWGPSGWSALLLMSSPKDMGFYALGLIVAMIMAATLTYVFVREHHMQKVS